jgi:hypothetical protein
MWNCKLFFSCHVIYLATLFLQQLVILFCILQIPVGEEWAANVKYVFMMIIYLIFTLVGGSLFH